MQKMVHVFTLVCPTVEFIASREITCLSACTPYRRPLANVASGKGHELLGVEEKSRVNSYTVCADVVGKMVVVMNNAKLQKIFGAQEPFGGQERCQPVFW